MLWGGLDELGVDCELEFKLIWHHKLKFLTDRCISSKLELSGSEAVHTVVGGSTKPCLFI